MVHAAQLDGRAVDEKLPLRGHADRAQTEAPPDDLARTAQLQCIQMRLLCVPQLRVRDRDGRAAVAHPLRDDPDAVQYPHPGRAVCRNFHALQIGQQCKVCQMPLRAAQQIYIAENAVKTEEILILQIAPHAPFMHADAQRVLPRVHQRGQVKFRRKMASLRKAGIVSVYKHLRAGADALQHQIGAQRIVRDRERPLINPQRILIRHIGRIDREGIIDVGVIGRFIAVQLPAGRDRNFRPLLRLSGGVAVGEKCKLPRSVQQLVLRASLWDVVRARRKPILRGMLHILIISHGASPFLLRLYHISHKYQAKSR